MTERPPAEELEIFQRLRDDLAHYALRCLQVRPKDARLGNIPLEFNRAQLYLHEQLEAQKAKTGKVRALILKGRQVGVSTYIAARFYHAATHAFGTRVFILTHEDEATQNLFGMVDRFHENCPDLVRPITGHSNAKELSFNKLDSGYAVGTARTTAVGRSQTIQLLHGSEVAFWPNAASHFAGLVQGVPDQPGTEIILESTANGIGNEFHQRWAQAERGEGDYQTIFLPWFWANEYQRIPPDDFQMTAEEIEFARLYRLGPARIAWRRNKIAELKDPVLFLQEYPSSAAEAFQAVGHDSYIPSLAVLQARRRQVEPSGPLVVGYDPAWKGKDRCSLARRRGRAVLSVESRQGLDTMAQVGWLKQVIDAERPAKVFLDVGGVGAGVYDRLVEMGYGDDGRNIVRGINFGSSPLEPEPLDERGKPKGGYANRRAEMWGKMREWLAQPSGVSIPDSDALHADLTTPGYRYDSLSRVLLESKDDIRRRQMPSPDEGDALALTFAEPVIIDATPVGRTGSNIALDPVAGY